LPKILVIDDDPVMRQLMSMILEREGHQVILAEDGLEGLAKRQEERPDLVITDMIMPRQGGLETIIRIREESPNAPIIAASGGGEIEGIHPLVMAMKHGATAVLNKPFGANELTECVGQALGGAAQSP
jgi:CheY-like chemotaxis protein